MSVQEANDAIRQVGLYVRPQNLSTLTTYNVAEQTVVRPNRDVVPMTEDALKLVEFADDVVLTQEERDAFIFNLGMVVGAALGECFGLHAVQRVQKETMLEGLRG